MSLSDEILCIIWAFSKNDSRRESVRKLAARVAELETKIEAKDKALEMVLLFHSPSPWDEEKRAKWFHWTGSDDATLKKMCDMIRSILGKS